MNVFGGARTSDNKGPRGPRGFRGKDSSIIDLCKWLPQTVLKNLQTYDEQCCYFINDPKKVLIRKGSAVKEWISRSHLGFNLKADKPSNQIEKLETEDDRYAITFKNTRYTSLGVCPIDDYPGAYGLLCITFRVTTDEDQVLLSNFQKSGHHIHCEIKITANAIVLDLHGATEIIQHSCKDWTTLFIDYTSDDETTHFTYNVNGQIGSFTTPKSHSVHEAFALGSRWDDSLFLDGQIAALEIYQIPDADPLPENVKNILIKNQTIEL